MQSEPLELLTNQAEASLFLFAITVILFAVSAVMAWVAEKLEGKKTS